MPGAHVPNLDGPALAARLRRLIDQAVWACSLDESQPRIAERVRIEQVNALTVLVGVMSVMGISTIMLVCYEYWGIGSRALLGSTSALIVGYYALIGLLSIRWQCAAQPASRRDAEWTLRALVWVLVMLGAAWGILFMDLMWFARGARSALLYAVVIGLMSSGVMVAPASAAFAFWAPVTLAGLVSIALLSGVADYGPTLLLLAYTSLTLFCIIYLNRAFIRRVLGEIDQQEGRETIGLLLRDFEESACDWLWETDERGRLTHVSDRFARVAGVSKARLLGSDFAGLLAARAHLPARANGQPARSDIAELMGRRLPFRDVEIAFAAEPERGGERIWWSFTGKPKLSERQVFEGYRGVGSDVTAARRATDRALFLAHYDELTGLANRRLFRETLERDCRRADPSHAALLCLDLDRFKSVNDSFGHPTGDALLAAVARRLEDQVRPGDLCARQGGDEFAVILRPADTAIACEIAGRLIESLSQPYQLDGVTVEVGVSIGIALPPPDASTYVTILRHADAALYQAKAQGRGIMRVYGRDMAERDMRRQIFRAELQRAIDQDELALQYQPIFDLASREVLAVEALVRWNRPGDGQLSAEEFVPLAERNGLIGPLGEWVLEHACRAALSLPPCIRMAVNVSPLQLQGSAFDAVVARALALTRLDPRRLELELTETAFLDMSEHTLDILHAVRALGVHVNLDDFGVGHTSLGHLRRFAFSALKIDRSFIQDLPGNESARAIVRAIAAMATELGIATTAEGIETSEHLALVRAVGCSNGQGFLLGRPASLAGVIELVGEAKEAVLF
jgi:diguanylate cyclase (GGDEF)-like protein